MARLYRLYRFKGSRVISWGVLQSLGVAVEARQSVSNAETALNTTPAPAFFNRADWSMGVFRADFHLQVE
jgi:hypothetical protein